MQPIIAGIPTATTAGTNSSADVRQSSVRARSKDAPESDAGHVRQAVESANAALQAISSDLEFTLDPSTGKTVVRVIDSGTQQVIRQFPSEEMLAIARAIDRFQGLLLREKA